MSIHTTCTVEIRLNNMELLGQTGTRCRHSPKGFVGCRGPGCRALLGHGHGPPPKDTAGRARAGPGASSWLLSVSDVCITLADFGNGARIRKMAGPLCRLPHGPSAGPQWHGQLGHGNHLKTSRSIYAFVKDTLQHAASCLLHPPLFLPHPPRKTMKSSRGIFLMPCH